MNNLLQTIADDVARVNPYVRAGMIERGIEPVGGFDEYSDDVLSELVTKVPQLVGAVSLAAASGDDAQAKAAVEAALDALQAIEPNALAPIDPFKDVCMLVYRRHFHDTASADAMVAHMSVNEARRQARQVADMLGIRLADIAEEARELGDQLRAAEVARQKKIVDEAAASRKRKTADDSDPFQFKRGVARHLR